MTQQRRDDRSESRNMSPDRASRRNFPPQPSYPADVLQPGDIPQPEYQGRPLFNQDGPLPPYFSMLMNGKLPPMMMLNLMWTTFVQSPQTQDSYVWSVLLILYWTRKIEWPLSAERLQQFKEQIIQDALKGFHRVYIYLCAMCPVESPYLLYYKRVTQITQEQFLAMPGWQQVYIRSIITMTSAAPMAPPPATQSPSRSPSPPQPQPVPPPTPPQFPPLAHSRYPPPHPPPISTPPPSDTRASTPEGPLDLSVMPMREYIPLAPYLLTSEQPPFQHYQHPWTRILESNDESPADESLAQRYRPEGTLSPPSNSPSSDCFIVSEPEHFINQSPMNTYRSVASYNSAESRPVRSSEFTERFINQSPMNSNQSKTSYSSCDSRPVRSSEFTEHFINQSPVNSYQSKVSCSSADSRSVSSSAFTPIFGHMASPTSRTPTPYYQPKTARSLERHPSRYLHSGSSLVDVSNTRKRAHSNKCAEGGSSEPPPKQTEDLLLRRSVISFEPPAVRSLEPSTVTGNVPNPTTYFPESPYMSGIEPSTSRSFMTSASSTIQTFTEIKNQAPPVHFSEPHTATYSYKRSSLRSFNLSGRGSNEPPPAHTPVPTSGQMTWPIPTHSFMSPSIYSPTPTLPHVPSPRPTPTHTPSPIRRPSSTITSAPTRMGPPSHTSPPTRMGPPSHTTPPTPARLTTKPQKISPIQPLAQYPAFSPTYMPMQPTMHMPRPLNYTPLSDPENISMPRLRREPTRCLLCGDRTHSANNCVLSAEYQRRRKQPRKK